MSHRDVRERFIACDFCRVEERCPENRSMPVGWSWCAPKIASTQSALQEKRDVCPQCRTAIDAFFAQLGKAGAA